MNKKIQPYVKPVFRPTKTLSAPALLPTGRLKICKSTPNGFIGNSYIIYDDTDNIEKGKLILIHTESLETCNRSSRPKWGHQQERYAITTGNIIEENGIKYYEVWADLYSYDHARVIDDALRNIHFKNFTLKKDNKEN